MTQMADKEEVITVRAAEDMPRDDFCRHMTLRHDESLGGLDSVDPDPLFTSDYVEQCWRAFHKQLHALGLQEHLDHKHGVSWG
jgi:hypothetical protein